MKRTRMLCIVAGAAAFLGSMASTAQTEATGSDATAAYSWESHPVSVHVADLSGGGDLDQGVNHGGSLNVAAAPVITVDPLPCQPWDHSVLVCATVTDADTPPDDLLVFLYYRNPDVNPFFTQSSMSRQYGVFCSTIDALFLPCGGADVEYYITASDGTTTVVSPTGAPANYHTFSICPNHDPVCNVPQSQTVVLCQPQQVCFPISASDVDGNLVSCEITDESGLYSIPTTGFQWCYTPFSNKMVTVDVHCYDDCGGECITSFTIDFIIQGPPTISCPSALTLECGDPANDALISDWLSSATGQAADGNVSLSNNYDPFNFSGGCSGGTGIQTVTFTATDDCGNIATCQSTITINDTQPPWFTFCPEDLHLGCGGAGNDAAIAAWLATAAGTDDCDANVQMTNDYDPLGFTGDCNTGTATQLVTFTARDDCGNTGNCQAMIIIGVACVPAPDGMVAWWTLDETSGSTASDLAGIHADDGIHEFNPTPTPGKVEGALCFNGVDQYLEVADDPEINFDTGDLSIDGWISTSDNTGVKVILDKRVSLPTLQGYHLALYNGDLSLQLADGISYTIWNSTAAVADGSWHHFAVTVDRDATDGIKFYRDGVQVGAPQNPTGRSGSLTNTSPLRIAVRSIVLDGYLNGCLDELELFNRVLRPAEIEAIYAAQSSGKCKCYCRHQSDFDVDGFLTSLDLGMMIDILFAGQPDVQDPGCPTPRADFDCDGFSTSLDLGGLIDHLFAGGGGPCDPCAP